MAEGDEFEEGGGIIMQTGVRGGDKGLLLQGAALRRPSWGQHLLPVVQEDHRAQPGEAAAGEAPGGLSSVSSPPGNKIWVLSLCQGDLGAVEGPHVPTVCAHPA